MPWYFWLCMILPLIIVIGLVIAFIEGVKGVRIQQLKTDYETTGSKAGGDGLIVLAWLAGVLIHQILRKRK